MPTTQPVPANQETDRKREAAALALLLLGTRRRYDLPALIRQHRIRKTRPFRQIRPTQSLAYDMAAPHYAIVNAWAAELPGILAAAPSGSAAVASAVERAAARVAGTVARAKAQFPGAVSRVELFHRRQWLSRVKASTGLDVSMLTTPQDVSEPVAATTSWNAALADDIHADTKAKMLALLLAGAASTADVKAKAAEVIAKAKKRAAGIGNDQTAKLSERMTSARREAAGVTSWMWQHNTEVHFRPEHKARNGQIFTDVTAPKDDLPGVKPFCRCVSIPVLQ